MRKLLALCSLVLAVGWANRGEIPLDPSVEIFEPHQRAMIAWDGTEEILLLSTDIRASDSTMVLEVLPLPAEPAVTKGDLETFRKVIALINRHQRSLGGKRNGGANGDNHAPAGEVTFHERIGSHDISVTHLVSAGGFVDWVNGYLDSIGVKGNVITDDMRKLIESYVAEDFTWFVFDAVTVATDTMTNDPIQYRFKTNSLFYPLKITSTAKGYTTIELLVLTPQLLRVFPGLPIGRVVLPHDPITIEIEELQSINADMYELLKGYSTMKLRIWRIRGELSEFDRDLIAR